VMMWASEAADETLPGDSSAPDDDDTRTMIPDRARSERVGRMVPTSVTTPRPT